MPAPTPVNTFAGLSLALDRMAERRDDAAWVAAQAAAATTRFLALDASGRTWLHPDQDALRWLEAAERQQLAAGEPAWLLGLAEGRAHFLLPVDDAHAVALDAAVGNRRISLREAGLLLPAFEAGMFAYAKGLAHWQRETRHCGYCGAPLEIISAGHRLRCTRRSCGRMHFPRTDTAVIMLVEHAGTCLLGRQASWGPGRWSTLAGFLEPGEALEDAVRREVMEESGVRVGAVRYHSSQPWPLPASLMAAFTATAIDPAIHRRDRELEDVRWFAPEQIAQGIADGSFVPSSSLSVSYHLLADWLRAQAGMDLDALVAAPR